MAAVCLFVPFWSLRLLGFSSFVTLNFALISLRSPLVAPCILWNSADFADILHILQSCAIFSQIFDLALFPFLSSRCLKLETRLSSLRFNTPLWFIVDGLLSPYRFSLLAISNSADLAEVLTLLSLVHRRSFLSNHRHCALDSLSPSPSAHCIYPFHEDGKEENR